MTRLHVLFCALSVLLAAACGSSDPDGGDAALVDVESQADASVDSDGEGPIEAERVETTAPADGGEATTTAPDGETEPGDEGDAGDSGEEQAETTTTSIVEETVPPVDEPLLLSPYGLSFAQPDGSLRTLGQGTSQDELLAALESVLGPRPDETLTPTECGQTFTGWPGVLDVAFGIDDGLFISWNLPKGSPLTDEAGIGLGSTRSDLELAWNTTFFEEQEWGVQFLVEGEEEFVDGMGGVMNGPEADAIITSLWGGQPCLAL